MTTDGLPNDKSDSTEGLCGTSVEKTINAESSASSEESKKNKKKPRRSKSVVKKMLLRVIRKYITFNYTISMTISFILCIIAICVRKKTIKVKFTDGVIHQLPLIIVFFTIAIMIAVYVISSICIKYILNYIQSKRIDFNLYFYCTINSTEHISLMIISLIFLAVSFYKGYNFEFKHETGISIVLYDIVFLVITCNFLCFLITFFTSMVSTTYNKETYTERMMNVFRMHFFFDLLKTIKNLKAKSNIPIGNVWQYCFPWSVSDADIDTFLGDDQKSIQKLYFKRDTDKVSLALHRDFIFHTFKKIPESVLYSESELDDISDAVKNRNKALRLSKVKNKGVMQVSDLEKYFGNDESYYQDFLKVFNFDPKTDLDLNFLQFLVDKNYYEIKNIQQSLKQILKALVRVQNFLYGLVVLLLVAYLFSRNPENTASAASVISGFFGTGILFQSSVTNAIDSIVFLFCIHPYDIGDRVFLVVDNVLENLVVSEMNVFSTVFVKYDGTVAYIPNSILGTKCITNVRRSGMMAESHKIQINADTPISKIDELEIGINNYLKSEPRIFTGFCMVNIENIENCNKMHLKIFVQHRYNWHDYNEYLRAKKGFLTFINEFMLQKNITYYLPEQTVHLKKEFRRMRANKVQ